VSFASDAEKRIERKTEREREREGEGGVTGHTHTSPCSNRQRSYETNLQDYEAQPQNHQRPGHRIAGGNGVIKIISRTSRRHYLMLMVSSTDWLRCRRRAAVIADARLVWMLATPLAWRLSLASVTVRHYVVTGAGATVD